MDVKLHVCKPLLLHPNTTLTFTQQPSEAKGFQLSFHLPYLAWRQTSKPSVDTRLGADCQPLRSTTDMCYLGAPSGQSRTYTHEAQMSCMIVGVDNRYWTAYGFFDTYHDGGESKHDVLSYQSTQGGVMMDPLTCGRFMSENPVWDAREYFLRVMGSCVHEVKEEWQNVGRQVLKALKLNVSLTITIGPFFSILLTHLYRPRMTTPAESNASRTKRSKP
jgi:hypothetical protein